jgi:hypothetical protein
VQIKLAITGSLAKFTKEVNDKLAAVAKSAVEGYARRVQLQLREDVRQGGLGEGVANAWRLNLYDTNSDKPAALVYSKAPNIVSAFGQDTTITARDGHLWLAIPTDNVPGFSGHRMNPPQVEASFHQKLIFLDVKPGTALAFVNAVTSKNARGFRPPTERRLAQGRARQLVLMFIMVQQVHLTKRLNWPTIMADAKAGFEQYFGEEIAKALGD